MWPHGRTDLAGPVADLVVAAVEGGQHAGSDRVLARPCAIPPNDVAMASIPLRKVVRGVAPVLRKPSAEILGDLRIWLGRGDPGR